MPRKPLIRSNVLPYHVSARCNNREPFHLPIEVVWKIMTEHCFEVSMLFGAQPHAFVLMPNHFHLLLTTPSEDLGKVMQQWLRSGTRALNQVSGRSGHVFGGRYHWTLVDTPNYFAHAYKYIYRNPVKANLCERVENYSYSTLGGLLGRQTLPFPLFYPYGQNGHLGVPEEMGAQLEWLNRPFKTEHEEAVQKALRRSQFLPAGQGWKRSLEELKKGLV